VLIAFHQPRLGLLLNGGPSLHFCVHQKTLPESQHDLTLCLNYQIRELSVILKCWTPKAGKGPGADSNAPFLGVRS
jgi:hypothetical protein